jgi:hypothetical protein
MTPHIIRDRKSVKIKDLKEGQIFYMDFDNFVFFSDTNKRYVEKFEDDGAIIQILSKKNDGTWGFNVKTKCKLDSEVFILAGEHVSFW